MHKENYILKEGESGTFSTDGEFKVEVKNGEVIITPLLCCGFIHVEEENE